MNIWILNHYAITPNSTGGTRHYDFSKELIKRGHKVTIFASSFHNILYKETKEYKDNDFLLENIERIQFIWIKTFPYHKNNFKRIINMLSYFLKVLKISKNLILEKPDIIIGSSVHLFAVYTGYLLSRRFNVPFIMEVRDLWPKTLIEMGIQKWHPLIILLGIMEKYLYKKSIKIITTMPNAREYIESLGIPKYKIVWISNGVDLNRFNILNYNLLEKKQKSIFIVTYTGAIGLVNNLDVLIKTAKILKNNYKSIQFLIVGEGPEKKRLVDLVNKQNIYNIEFKNSVPQEEIYDILAKSDALFFGLKNINLYKYGISCNKIFDYLASGKPIIFSADAINNPVKEAMAGITVSPDSPEEIAKAIIKLYNMPKERRLEMGLNGKKYVKKHYSIPVLVDKLEDLLYKVINNS